MNALRSSTSIWFALVTGCLTIAGCNSSSPPAPKKANLSGVALSVRVPADSPFVDVIEPRLGDWRSQTGSDARTAKEGENADLEIVRGTALFRRQPRRAFRAQALEDERLRLAELPAVYRLVFGTAGADRVGLPLATEQLLLWHRADLFEDPDLIAEFKQKTKGTLRPPETWKEFLEVAKYFTGHPKCEFGCVEATDASIEASRCFLARAAAYSKGPNWSSFAIDAETGAPRLADPGYVRALEQLLEASKHSPAGGGKAISAREARKLFRDGKTAMILDTIPPTIEPADPFEPDPDFSVKVGVAPLPGAETLFELRTGGPADLAEPNRCVYYATTGWFLALDKPGNQEAAEALAIFLAQGAEPSYLAPACRRGFIPIHALLRSTPNRFDGYGLSSKAVTRYFGVLSQNEQAQNWVSDLRTENGPALMLELAGFLRQAQEGKASPKAVLEQAAAAWESKLGENRSAFVHQFRLSLGLPTIPPE